MQIIDCVQQTPEWYAARLGVPSSSNFDKIITTQGHPSKQAEKYLYKLAGEKVSGQYEETYQNATMIRGCEMEEEARKFYEMINNTKIEQVGFCIENGAGASPDGFVGDDGLIEIKCPLVATHVSYLIDNKLPTAYFQQVQGQMAITGRKWVDFVSYFPGLKPLIVHVERNEDFILALKVELKLFCEKLDEVIKQIK